MITINGKAGIVAKILCDSISEAKVRLTTYELTYPRIIHSEILTHKMLCSNSASSRAIPFERMKEQLTGIPVRFGKANKGMQDNGSHAEIIKINDWSDGLTPEEAWNYAKETSEYFAEKFNEAGYAKQIVNRLTETFQMMKTVISGTEWENFFWLRNDGAADPTIAELARCMKKARDKSVPGLLLAGEWHLPYVGQYQECVKGEYGPVKFYIGGTPETGFEHLTLDEAIKVSCARTAAVSFRAEDYGLEQCLRVYERLIGDEKKHASALQHQATPMKRSIWSWNDENRYVNIPHSSGTWEKGVSHATRDGKLWSGQFKQWIMHRKTVEGENYEG